MLAKEYKAYISIDVETAGPNPSLYSLLSIGACMVSAEGTCKIWHQYGGRPNLRDDDARGAA